MKKTIKIAFVLYFITILFTTCAGSISKKAKYYKEDDIAILVKQLLEGGTIVLEKKVYDFSENWTTIQIDENIQIKGNGATIIGPSTRAFFYSSGSVLIENLRLVNFSTAIGLSRTSKNKKLTVRKCTFENNIAAIYSEALTSLKAVEIHHNSFKGDLLRSKRAIFISVDTVDIFHITNNIIKGYQNYGISITGKNKNNSQRKEIKISNNIISSLTNEADTSSNKQNIIGIRVEGWKPIIEENTISNINGKAKDDKEGIYVKAAYAKIINNRLINAGIKEGFVAIKGKKKGNWLGGYGVLVENNYFEETRGLKSHFLRIANENVSIKGNTFINGYQGIHTNSSAAGNNILIVDNTFENISQPCINFHLNKVQHLVIEGNTFRNFRIAVNFDRCKGLSQVKIIKNSFINAPNTQHSAIILNSPSVNYAISGLSIEANDFENLNHAIYVKKGLFNNLIVQNNRLKNVSTKALHLSKAAAVN